MHLAMWSGPRNISTAMMRAFENRTDTVVMDEPFYAAYLRNTGLDHPGRELILEHQENDWRKVVDACSAPPPEGVALVYQKHMTHHMLDHYDTEWLRGMHHCFLLRSPERVLASYEKKREQPTLSDIGLAQQVELFEQISAQASVPPLVIDSADFLQQPRAFLERVCEHIGLPFSPRMLSWPSGKRDSDGVWAEHWYNQVWSSTGFKSPGETSVELPAHLQNVFEEAQPLYAQLHQHRLQIG